MQVLQATVGRALAALPALVRGGSVGLCMIVFMTYAAMPAVTRWLAPWLFKPSAGAPRSS
jgi:antibiotic biosynthesis monooxygenase (ABM) superfamily enzyme